MAAWELDHGLKTGQFNLTAIERQLSRTGTRHHDTPGTDRRYSGPVSWGGFVIDSGPAVTGFLGSYATGGGVSLRS